MKKIIKYILSQIIRLLIKLVKRNKSIIDFIFQETFTELENNAKFFLSLNKIPKNIKIL